MTKALCLTVLAVSLAIGTGCGSDPSSPASGITTEDPIAAEAASLRDSVMRGVTEDFDTWQDSFRRFGPDAVEPPPVGFVECFSRRFERALTPRVLEMLVLVHHRRGGQPFAAQALVDLGAPVSARCGHPFLTPKLIEASRGLRGGRLFTADARRLGIEYGPFLQVTCQEPYSIRCDKIRFHVVLKRRARGLRVRVASRPIHVATSEPDPIPSAAIGRDWDGYLYQAGMTRKGGLLNVQLSEFNQRDRTWGGYPHLLARVKITATWPHGSKTAGVFRKVFLSPATR